MQHCWCTGFSHHSMQEVYRAGEREWGPPCSQRPSRRGRKPRLCLAPALLPPAPPPPSPRCCQDKSRVPTSRGWPRLPRSSPLPWPTFWPIRCGGGMGWDREPGWHRCACMGWRGRGRLKWPYMVVLSLFCWIASVQHPLGFHGIPWLNSLCDSLWFGFFWSNDLEASMCIDHRTCDCLNQVHLLIRCWLSD